MKKFIKALEEKGIMEKLIDSLVVSEKFAGIPVGQTQDAVKMILEFEMSKEEELEDLFLQEAHEIAMTFVFEYVKKQIVEKQKVEALNGVNFNALFEKATKKKEILKKDEELDKKIENLVLDAMEKTLHEFLGDMLKNMFDDCK